MTFSDISVTVLLASTSFITLSFRAEFISDTTSSSRKPLLWLLAGVEDR
ncbi:Uncharacterized protein APZ42_006500 [Daphnia magna]|uniref:Uncharacterized protein n=1 Tax=Daphnia magna TaxID=35525 RepID=A0A164FV66_9CRUS|nr:Uncharacterized protein APZ42_006500 [Daphnia magna]